MVAKATVTALASTLSMSLADVNAIDRYYDDIVYERSLLLANTTTAAATAGTAVYALGALATELLALFFDGAYLFPTMLKELEAAAGPGWRDATGTPTHWLTEEETENNFRVWPTPDVAGTLRLVYGEYRADVPTWLEPAIAWDILAREFQRDSDHRDPAFAAACAFMAQRYYVAVI